LVHLLQAGDNEEAVMNAIKYTAESTNSVLVDKLMHFLMGESDGVPKVNFVCLRNNKFTGRQIPVSNVYQAGNACQSREDCNDYRPRATTEWILSKRPSIIVQHASIIEDTEYLCSDRARKLVDDPT
jgi:hypothetical protein